jgi:hypothetical protein
MNQRLLRVCGRRLGQAAALLLLMPWATPAAAQQPAAPQMNMAAMDHRGALQGRVRNDSGAAVADATVMAVNAENGAQFTATTDAQGAYSFGALPVGRYNLSVTIGGLVRFNQRDVEVMMDASRTLDVSLTAATAAQAAEGERQELLEKIATLEQRITDLESNTVLSEPETRVRRVEVYVDPTGGEHEEPVPGATQVVTYQRERVYRRQTISEKIEEALDDAANRNVAVGVDAAMGTQFAGRVEGEDGPDASAYALASADLFFTAGLARNTPSSLPTSSGSAGHRPTLKSPR